MDGEIVCAMWEGVSCHGCLLYLEMFFYFFCYMSDGDVLAIVVYLCIFLVANIGLFLVSFMLLNLKWCKVFWLEVMVGLVLELLADKWGLYLIMLVGCCMCYG